MRDTCAVINAPCSFGRVCEVTPSFCPRHVEQSKPSLLSSTSSAYGRDAKKAFAYKFIICCISVTSFLPSVLGVSCGF